MIAIDIVNYSTWEITMRCVESIRKVCSLPYHIYIVDNASPNDAYAQLCNVYKEADDVTVIASGRNGGYGYGLNCGIRAALADGCDAVIASNNDIVYQRGAIEELYDTIRSSEDIVVAGAQQILPDGTRQRSAIIRAYSKTELALWYLPFRSRINLRRNMEERTLEEAQGRIPVAFPMGGCYMLDVEILKGDDFFDNDVFMYAEEKIIGEKIALLNKKVILCSDAQVIHKHGSTSKHSLAQFHLAAAPSMYIFCKKYAGLNDFALSVHKCVYYFLMAVKCLLLSDYRKRIKALFSVFQ